MKNTIIFIIFLLLNNNLFANDIIKQNENILHSDYLCEKDGGELIYSDLSSLECLDSEGNFQFFNIENVSQNSSLNNRQEFNILFLYQPNFSKINSSNTHENINLRIQREINQTLSNSNINANVISSGHYIIQEYLWNNLIQAVNTNNVVNLANIIANDNFIYDLMIKINADFFVFVYDPINLNNGNQYDIDMVRFIPKSKPNTIGNLDINRSKSKINGMIYSSSSIISNSNASKNLTPSHEFGHLLGLHHSAYDTRTNYTNGTYDILLSQEDNMILPYAKGYKKTSENSVSIMSYDGTQEVTIVKIVDSLNNTLLLENIPYKRENKFSDATTNNISLTTTNSDLTLPLIKNNNKHVANSNLNEKTNVIIYKDNIRYENNIIENINVAADSVGVLEITIPQILALTENGTDYLLNTSTSNDDKIFLSYENYDEYLEILNNSGNDEIYLSTGKSRIDLSSGNKKIFIKEFKQSENGFTELLNFDKNNDEIYVSNKYAINEEYSGKKKNNSGTFDYYILLESNNNGLINYFGIYFKNSVGEVTFRMVEDTNSVELEDSIWNIFNIFDNSDSKEDFYLLQDINIEDDDNYDGIYHGTINDDIITGDYNPNYIFGYAGNDILGSSSQTSSNSIWLGDNSGEIGFFGDTFNGGQGNDTIYGTRHGDNYVYKLGDGYDYIYEKADINMELDPNWDVYRDDFIFFEDIPYGDGSNIEITRSGYDVIVSYTLDNNSGIVIKNYLTKTTYNNQDYFLNAIEYIVFSDNVILNKEQIIEMALTYHGDTNNNSYNGLNDYNNQFYGYEGSDSFYSSNGDNIFYGHGGNDKLFAAGNGVNYFYGGDGSDYIGAGTTSYGIVNNLNNSLPLDQDLGQKLYGGKGNDKIYGTKFGDYYYYELGDGIDTIYENSPNINEFTVDKIIFVEGITPSMVKINRQSGNDDMYLELDNSNKIFIRDFYVSSKQVEEVHFQDGTIWTSEYIMEQGLIYHGDENNNSYWGLSDYDNQFYGYEGGDSFYSSNGDNIFYGHGGGDRLFAAGNGVNYFYGGDGSDYIGAGTTSYGIVNNLNNSLPLDQDLGQKLYGGKGNDKIYGTKFGDYYYYELGDGIDTIYENSPNINEFTIDKLYFNFSSSMVTFIREGNYLTIFLGDIDSTERIIRISNFYLGSNYEIEEFIFSNTTINNYYAKQLGENNKELKENQ